MNFASLKVSTRLTLGFGCSVLLGTVIAVTGIVRMDALADKVSDLANDRMPKVDKLNEIRDNSSAVAMEAFNALLLPDPSAKAAALQQLHESRAKNAELLSDLDKTIVNPRARDLLKTIGDLRPLYNEAVDRSLVLGQAGKTEEALGTMFGEVRDIQSKLFMAIAQTTEVQNQTSKDIAQESVDLAASSKRMLLILAASMAVVGGLIGWALSRSLSRALGAEPAELNAAVQRVADGDLATPVNLRPDDTQSTMAAVGRMHKALAEIVNSVRGNSDSVATASAQIAQGNQDLSSRTEEQASALQETAASMEQLGTTVEQNAENAQQANQLALSASTVAVKGGEVVGQVVATMKDINTSSKKIADIISVIDGIAFQTNILALNAAVEAARAGEQGRGFAVVAGEVRTLAQRSAEAAKEIKTLITASVERVEQGTALVDQAGGTMSEIVSAIQRVTDIMGEISTATSEQSSGVTQIGEAVSQMDQATQQNAALVEESAAAAESLKQQANELVRAVSSFRLAPAQASRPDQARAPLPEAVQPKVFSSATTPAQAAAKPRAAKVNVRAGLGKSLGLPVVEEWAAF